mmetsp:Transcript_3477/g.14012  ORF Transcript_3477/g.14012 Transcript_3477/m.14012 type:complete len:221 (+) Transcript_3477:1508-2170(+)
MIHDAHSRASKPHSARKKPKNADWYFSVLGTTVGSPVFSFSSSSFMGIQAVAVTSASPTANAVASESHRRMYTSSKQLQPPRSACSAGTQQRKRSSSPSQTTPSSSASSRTAVGRDSSPLSMCPAALMSHRSGNVSLFGERFCNATRPRAGSTSQTCTERCHIFIAWVSPLVIISPVGSGRSRYTSNDGRGGRITSNISDDDCASARAFGLSDVIAARKD